MGNVSYNSCSSLLYYQKRIEIESVVDIYVYPHDRKINIRSVYFAEREKTISQ